MSTFNFKNDFTWPLNICTPLTEEFKSVQGNAFSPKLGCFDKFCLELEFDRNHWTLSLRKVSGTALKDLNVSCCLTITNKSGDVWFEYSSGSGKPVDATRTRLMSKNFSGYYKDQLGREFLWPDHKVFLNGTLYFCEKNPDIIPAALSGNKPPVDCEQLHADLGRLYQEGISFDITFCFGEKKLFAHKAILECRSPVFEKTFKEEGCPSYFSITDFDIHEFNRFLLFLYTGKIENTPWYTVRSLHALADKYQIECLRKACLRTMGKELSIESACGVLQFAVEKNYIELKEKATSYIRKHFSEVARTSDWCKIVISKPDLAREV